MSSLYVVFTAFSMRSFVKPAASPSTTAPPGPGMAPMMVSTMPTAAASASSRSLASRMSAALIAVITSPVIAPMSSARPTLSLNGAGAAVSSSAAARNVKYPVSPSGKAARASSLRTVLLMAAPSRSPSTVSTRPEIGCRNAANSAPRTPLVTSISTGMLERDLLGESGSSVIGTPSRACT